MASAKKATKKVLPKGVNGFKNWKNLLIYSVVFVFLALMFMGFNQSTITDQSATIPLSQAVQDAKAGKIQKIEVQDNKLVLTEGNKTYQAFKEPGSDVYTFFKDAGVKADKIE